MSVQRVEASERVMCTNCVQNSGVRVDRAILAYEYGNDIAQLDLQWRVRSEERCLLAEDKARAYL